MRTAVVIDDEDTIRHLMKLYLRKLDFKVYEASNGAEGLGVCLFQRPDLVITDISMPEYDGLQLIELMRKSEDLKKTKIIVMSGVDFLNTRTSKEAGGDFFLQKPFRREELLDALKILGF